MAGQQDSKDANMLSIQVDKRPISQAQLAGFLAVLAAQIFIAGGLYYKFTTLATEAASKADFALLTAKVESQDQMRAQRSASLDRNIDEMQTQLRPLATIELRMDQNDKRDDAQDVRIDKILELVSGKLDTINDTVSGLKADVRVISQDVKNLSGKIQPTNFRSP